MQIADTEKVRLPGAPVPAASLRTGRPSLPDLRLGVDNLLSHKLRSLLTMLGMVFGVAAVVSMLSIGAGAQQKVMSFIEQLGVHNLIIEAKEMADPQASDQIRQLSPGLTFRDYRIIVTTMGGIRESTPRKRFIPSKLIPRPRQDMPVLYGVAPAYKRIAGLHLVAGRFFDDAENATTAPVCLLGEGAKANLFGPSEAVGKFIKVNEQWFHVIGVVGPRLSLQDELAGIPARDLNNLIYVPLNAAILRLDDSASEIRDEIDGIYLALDPHADSVRLANTVRGILNALHRNAGDFAVIVPAELMAEQGRTRRLFELVMVSIASISLLVGGIGIMNIMLASIFERTREIGIRRAVGARQIDIVRQFVTEAVLISFVGGVVGIIFGFGMAGLIAWLAGWSTIVTVSSITLAFLVSVAVGLTFGIYPAFKAAHLDPIEALRYE